MSSELRRLLHTAAETGPVPDVDAILAQVRRRHRRRVALSMGTSVLVIVIAIATLWPGRQQARLTVVRPPTACPKPAVRDLNSYRPSYLLYGFLNRPQTLAATKDNATYKWTNYDTGASLMLHVRRILTVQRVVPTDNSFAIDCGRGSIEQSTDTAVPSPPQPAGVIVQTLVWRLDAETEAVLVLERSADLPSTKRPTVGELVKMAQSVAVCPMNTDRCRFL